LKVSCGSKNICREARKRCKEKQYEFLLAAYYRFGV
jgi:hypothetical protein